MSTYRSVKSAVKALKVLTLLNRHSNVGLSELFALSGVPKPSLVRLLETLIVQKYVERDASTGAYRVAARAAGLSEGFHGGPLLVEAGRELCIDLTRRLKWPISIAVLNGTAMFALFSTVPDSPVAPYRPMFTKPRGLLESALGRAYLAFCSDAEREILTRMLKHEGTRPPEEIDAQIDEIIRKARTYGFADRDASRSPLKNASIAIPLRGDRRILGTLGITYFGSAIRRNELVEKIVVPLREAAGLIEAKIDVIRRTLPSNAANASHSLVSEATFAHSAVRATSKENAMRAPAVEESRLPLLSPSQAPAWFGADTLPELRVLPQSVIGVISAVEADIIRRRILPGARLLEDNLMAAYRAKRHTVRAALEELERLGIVEKPRKRGATLRRFDAKDIGSLFETYGVLQCAAVERLRPPTPEQWANINYWLDCYAHTVRAKNVSLLHRADAMFHDAIFSLCANSPLAKTIRCYDWMTFPISAYSLGDDTVLEQGCADHQEMIVLLRANRLSDLRELTLSHSLAGRRFYERQFVGGTGTKNGTSALVQIPRIERNASSRHRRVHAVAGRRHGLVSA